MTQTHGSKRKIRAFTQCTLAYYQRLLYLPIPDPTMVTLDMLAEKAWATYRHRLQDLQAGDAISGAFNTYKMRRALFLLICDSTVNIYLDILCSETTYY